MGKWTASRFRAGDLVEVRSADEIFATLDPAGCVDGMPFMPEMLAFCGRQLRVAASAHKTCDPAHKTGGRRLSRSVHLQGTRCDGFAHGGCEAECNLFWNDAWLKPVDSGQPQVVAPASVQPGMAARLPARRADGSYTCQATELIHASEKLPAWSPRQYWLDIRTRNHTVGKVARALVMSWSRLLLRIPFGYRFWVGANDAIHRLLIGRPAPRVQGQVPAGQKTPTVDSSLEAGDVVRVRAVSEIAATLDPNSKNRGMWFDVEQIEFCGREYPVHRRIRRILDERTGQMVELKNPCLVLKGVYCGGEHSADRVLCPRAITPYWREIWLDRVK